MRQGLTYSLIVAVVIMGLGGVGFWLVEPKAHTLADGLWRDEALTFDRAFYFFDAMTIEAARANWRIVSKLEGVEARFHRQEGGRWIRAA